MAPIQQVPHLQDYSSLCANRPPPAPGTRTPRVSMVTIVLNSANTVERTIRTVQEQTFQDIEHIVIDGGSTDGTQDLLAKLLRPQDYWISERDRGISDAFNKGVALARGEFLQFINADDWMELNQVELAVAALDRCGADFVFGDLLFYQDGVPTFRYRGDPDYGRKLSRLMPAINHPTVLARISAYERIGLFNFDYKCAMEYDWFLRLHRSGGVGVHDPSILGHMTHDGISNVQFRRTIDEVRRISVAHGRPAALAAMEAFVRRSKTTLGFRVKRHAFPLYQFIRANINRSYSRI